VRGLLSSPRKRRRAAWLGSLLLVVAGLVTLGILYPNTAKDNEPEAVPAQRAAQIYREPKTVRLTKTDREVALRNALEFVNTAVARRRVERSYELVTPELRQGLTRTDWAKGEIPVVPFPATEVRARIDYSYANEIGLTMLLVPPASSRTAPATFNMDMRALGPSGKRRWLVSSWTPTANMGQMAGADAATGAEAAGFPNIGATADAQRGLDAPLSARWIAVPLSIIGLALLVPIGLGVRSWVQNRRALREYEASRALDL
jgi:hypothetical protein